MFVKTYEFHDSTAIFTIKMGKDSVFVTYNRNIDKEYEFNCEKYHRIRRKCV